MFVTSHRRPLVVLGAIGIGWLATACSPSQARREPTVPASIDTSSAAIAVATTPSYVTIENRAGLPLVDLNIAVRSTTGLSFGISISRLESSEKRELGVGTLRSRDGTEFNPRFQRPVEVRVTATDLVGKKYEVSAPWKYLHFRLPSAKR